MWLAGLIALCIKFDFGLSILITSCIAIVADLVSLIAFNRKSIMTLLFSMYVFEWIFVLTYFILSIIMATHMDNTKTNNNLHLGLVGGTALIYVVFHFILNR